MQEAKVPLGEREKTHLCSLFIGTPPKGCVNLLKVLSSAKVQKDCPVEGSRAPATDVTTPALRRCL